jgi:hypothetical protein
LRMKVLTQGEADAVRACARAATCRCVHAKAWAPNRRRRRRCGVACRAGWLLAWRPRRWVPSPSAGVRADRAGASVHARLTVCAGSRPALSRRVRARQGFSRELYVAFRARDAALRTHVAGGPTAAVVAGMVVGGERALHAFDRQRYAASIAAAPVPVPEPTPTAVTTPSRPLVHFLAQHRYYVIGACVRACLSTQALHSPQTGWRQRGYGRRRWWARCCSPLASPTSSFLKS